MLKYKTYHKSRAPVISWCAFVSVIFCVPLFRCSDLVLGSSNSTGTILNSSNNHELFKSCCSLNCLKVVVLCKVFKLVMYLLLVSKYEVFQTRHTECFVLMYCRKINNIQTLKK